MFIYMQKINCITHFFLKILERNSKGGIQLLRSHLEGWGGVGGGSIKIQTYANWVRRGHMSVRTFAYKSLKRLSRPSKRKRNTEMARNCG